MKHKRLISKIEKVLGDEQLNIREICNRLYDELTYYPETNRLSKIMRGRFEMVSIGEAKTKKNEWRNKNVMDRKIQTGEIE